MGWYRGRRPQSPRKRRVSGGWWVAKTTHHSENPQLCGLSGRQIVGTDTVSKEEASVCFFLTTKGSEPLPVAQIEISRKEDEYPTGYRAVPSGEYLESRGPDGVLYRRPVFKHQELRDGEWHDIATWSRAVLVEEAERRGFKVPGGICRSGGLKGARTLGHEHRLGPAEEPLQTLANAFEAIEPTDPNPVTVEDPPPEQGGGGAAPTGAAFPLVVRIASPLGSWGKTVTGGMTRKNFLQRHVATTDRAG